MVVVPVEKIASVGLISDLPNHQLQPEGWSTAYNVRFRRNRVERIDGWQEVMNPPTVAPAFIMNVDFAGDSFWIYASSIGAGSKVYAYNSGAHADISKAGNYNVTNTYSWNGTTFQGIPLVNPGTSAPQYWASLNLAVDLADFPAWPAATTAAVIRQFKNYIIALAITDAGGAHIHRVMWSDGAAPGTMPSSWDVTNPAVEAAHRDLSDTDSGGILDGLPLKDFFVIYKNDSTWLMRYIGGTQIMGTNQVAQVSGLLAHRCVCQLTLPAQKTEVHFLHNGLDLGVFDGQGFESVINNKVRAQLAADIDPTTFRLSYVVDDPANNEAMFVYPAVGATMPNRALVWNYQDNIPYFRDFVGVHAAKGVVEGADTTTWDADTFTWDSESFAQWQEAQRKKVVIADQAGTKLYRLGGLNTKNGVSFSASLKRRGLAVVDQDRQGNLVTDTNTRKLVTRIWPKITGAPLNIRIGGEEYPHDNSDESGLYWLPYQSFDPAGGFAYVDFIINTRLIALEYQSDADQIWKLEGYGIDVQAVSEN